MPNTRTNTSSPTSLNPATPGAAGRGRLALLIILRSYAQRVSVAPSTVSPHDARIQCTRNTRLGNTNRDAHSPFLKIKPWARASTTEPTYQSFVSRNHDGVNHTRRLRH